MSQETDRELARLWRVNRTIREMMRDRGYLQTDAEVEMSFDDFKEKHSGQPDRVNMSFTADAEDLNRNDRIYVYFCGEKSPSKNAMKTFVSSLDKLQARRGLMVYMDKLSSVANKTMVELAADYHLEAFKESDLLVNITHHFLVPKHTIMSPKEKVELIKKYRLKDTQLPRIMPTDPVARYYGMKRGQVMKIERASETAGRYITYRICM